MAIKQIFDDLAIEVKGTDKVWPPKISAPVHNVPKGLIMYATIRYKRAGYELGQIEGHLVRYFESKGYVVVPNELKKVFKKTETLINKANGVNARSYATETLYKNALKALDGDITDGMTSDWVTNIKDAKSVSTYSQLQDTFPSLEE